MIEIATINEADIKRIHNGLVYDLSLQIPYLSGTRAFTNYGLTENGKGHAFGMECIKQIIDVVDVESWNNLIGKQVRIDYEINATIEGIGNIQKDVWFYPEHIKYFVIEKFSQRSFNWLTCKNKERILLGLTPLPLRNPI